MNLVRGSQAAELGLISKGNLNLLVQLVGRIIPLAGDTLISIVKGKLPGAVQVEKRIPLKIGTGMLGTGIA